MKKTLFILLGVGFLSLLIGIGIFTWKNLRGIGPAILKPSQNIAESINTTGMPLQLPPGFSIEIFAKDLGKPRVMMFDPLGTLLVSIPSQGKIVALPDKNQDGMADEIITVAEDLNRPHGLALKAADEMLLYIAETDKVTVYAYDPLAKRAAYRRKLFDLPDGGEHFTRTIVLYRHPDGSEKMLVTVGSSCNVCHEKDWRRAKMLIYDFETGKLDVFASGLRNAVFIKIHPNTNKVWVTEMGQDLLGDDLPPDEINIVEEGKNYGWPICYGKNVCADKEPSYIDIPAHSAPLGLAFIPPEKSWPEDYSNNLLVSYHGSWNRSIPTGYKIVRHKFDKEGNYLGVEDFINGWLKDGEALGRPVDILFHADGWMFISDDKAGVIYRVSYLK